MKSTGILMSAPMIQAYQKSLKTETRRLKGLKEINERPNEWEFRTQGVGADSQCNDYNLYVFEHEDGSFITIKCPYGDLGDQLIFRETWAVGDQWDNSPPSQIYRETAVHFLADGEKPLWNGRTRSPLHLPNDLARFKPLLVARPIPQRLHDMTEADCEAEGVPLIHTEPEDIHWYRPSFTQLWDTLHPEHPYSGNWWTWALKFERYEEE